MGMGWWGVGKSGEQVACALYDQERRDGKGEMGKELSDYVLVADAG